MWGDFFLLLRSNMTASSVRPWHLWKVREKASVTGCSKYLRHVFCWIELASSIWSIWAITRFMAFSCSVGIISFSLWISDRNRALSVIPLLRVSIKEDELFVGVDLLCRTFLSEVDISAGNSPNLSCNPREVEGEFLEHLIQHRWHIRPELFPISCLSAKPSGVSLEFYLFICWPQEQQFILVPGIWWKKA